MNKSDYTKTRLNDIAEDIEKLNVSMREDAIAIYSEIAKETTAIHEDLKALAEDVEALKEDSIRRKAVFNFFYWSIGLLVAILGTIFGYLQVVKR